MTTADRSLLAEPARQSPLAFVFIAWRFVRRLGLSAIAAAVLFVVNGGLAVGTWTAAVVVSIGLLVFSALSWWRFTFCVVDDELVVTRGIASVERLVIPLERVQSVSIDQRLFHRPFGLVRAAVDTAGSAEVEFEIDAIDTRRAEALRRVATDARSIAATTEHGAAPVAAVEHEEVVLSRTPADLLRIGLTKMPWAGLVVFAPLLAFGDELGALQPVADGLERVADGVVDAGDGSVLATIGVVVGVVAAVTVLGGAFQVVREIVTNWQLTLTRTPSGLRRTAGLLNTTSRSSTAQRVQILTTDDTAPQRWLRFTRLTLHAFGTGSLDLPGSSADEVARVRRLAFGFESPIEADREISRWSVFVAVRNAVVVHGLIAFVAWFAIGWWSLLALAVVPARAVIADRRWRRRRWGLDGDRLAEGYGLVWRHRGELPLHKAQVVTVRQSFFERRRGLATLQVSTAGGAMSIPFIERDIAGEARDIVLDRAERDRRRVL